MSTAHAEAVEEALRRRPPAESDLGGRGHVADEVDYRPIVGVIDLLQQVGIATGVAK